MGCCIRLQTRHALALPFAQILFVLLALKTCPPHPVLFQAAIALLVFARMVCLHPERVGGCVRLRFHGRGLEAWGWLRLANDAVGHTLFQLIGIARGRVSRRLVNAWFVTRIKPTSRKTKEYDDEKSDSQTNQDEYRQAIDAPHAGGLVAVLRSAKLQRLHHDRSFLAALHNRKRACRRRAYVCYAVNAADLQA